MEREIKDVVDSVVGNVGVLSAINKALNNPDDYDAAFNSNFILAKNFFFLGHFDDSVEAVMAAINAAHADPERVHEKQAAYTKDGVPSLILVGVRGEIILRQKNAAFTGPYADFDDRFKARIAHLIYLTIMVGAPFTTMMECLDRLVQNYGDELARRWIEKLFVTLDR